MNITIDYPGRIVNRLAHLRHETDPARRTYWEASHRYWLLASFRDIHPWNRGAYRQRLSENTSRWHRYTMELFERSYPVRRDHDAPVD